MKKIKFLITSLFALFFLTNTIYAQSIGGNDQTKNTEQSDSINKDSIKILTTEKVFGYNCVCAVKADKGDKDTVNGYKQDKIGDGKTCENLDITKKKYICTVESGFSGLQNTFREIIRWVVQISILLGVVGVAAFGVAYSIAGSGDPAYKKFLKEWLTGLIIGLLILFFFRYILLGVAPWVFTN